MVAVERCDDLTKGSAVENHLAAPPGGDRRGIEGLQAVETGGIVGRLVSCLDVNRLATRPPRQGIQEQAGREAGV